MRRKTSIPKHNFGLAPDTHPHTPQVERRAGTQLEGSRRRCCRAVMLVAVNEMSPGTNDPTVTGTTVNNMMAGEESFAQFCQTYGPHEKKEHTTTNVYNQNSETTTTADHLSSLSIAISSSEESGVSFWNHLCSSYWPVLLLWVKSSMFGTANMVRSLILGNFLLFVLHQFNPPEAVQQSAWWNTLCAALGATNAKADPQAWPPPALTALAILTVVALIIHPDGFTWIIWRNIRYVMLQSCLAMDMCGILFLLFAHLYYSLSRYSNTANVSSK